MTEVQLNRLEAAIGKPTQPEVQQEGPRVVSRERARTHVRESMTRNAAALSALETL